jgi:hypothetical protein
MIARLEEQILDLKQTLAGNPNGKTWKELKTKLTNLEATLSAQIQYQVKHGFPKVPGVPSGIKPRADWEQLETREGMLGKG